MGVPIIENWSTITGVALSIEPSKDLEQFVVVTVAVDRVDPVDGFANLLAGAAGQELSILAPSDVVQSAGLFKGARIVVRVRRAGADRVFVHQQQITVQPGSPSPGDRLGSVDTSDAGAEREPGESDVEPSEGTSRS
jgi:hypothetical protein